MIIKTFFAGFGGQGVLSMGYTLAYAAMLDNKHVTYFPSYGAEVRGGTANCTVAVGDEEIASPIASEPEYIVALNKPSVLKFENWVSPGGLMFVNTSLVDQIPTRSDIEVVEVPANMLAGEVANERAANMVMLGVLAQKPPLGGPEAFREAIAGTFANKAMVRDVNLKAFEHGYQYLAPAGGEK
jgi:2-oxoglutarate ferredoxin oxidoreductase subunit gamma